MFFYALLVPIIAILAILWLVIRVRNGKNTIGSLLVWILLWIILVLFVLIPKISTFFASLFGITRGLDFIVVVVLAVMAYIIFRLYNKVDKLENNFNKIITEMAIANEISLSDDDEE